MAEFNLEIPKQYLHGPLDLKQRGSVSRSYQLLFKLQLIWTRVETDWGEWEEAKNEACQDEIWKHIPPEKPFGSLENMLEAAGIHSYENQKAWISRHSGGRTQAGANDAVSNEKGQRTDLTTLRNNSQNIANLAMSGEIIHNQSERANKNGVSLATQKKLDHLARHRPDLLEYVKSGELSANAAYKEAKGIKDPTPLDNLKKWWKKAKQYEKERFLEWVESEL